MTSKLLVVSNNPQVWAESAHTCRKVEGSSLNVLYTCLEILGEEKHVLFAHPVAGNARLVHNPFRSVVLEEKEDAAPEEIRDGIRTLAYFIEKMEDLNGDVPPGTRDDYRVVDYELFKAVIPAHL